MADTPLVIDERPRGARARANTLLRGRRLLVAAGIALAEVVALIVVRPSLVVVTAVAFAVMVAAIWGALRVRKGLARDVLWVLAISQGFVIVLPLALGVGVLAGLLVAAGLLAALVVIAIRMRV